MAGQVKINQVQLGDHATATNNFVLQVPTPPDGTLKIARGNVGATTQDVMAIDASGNATFIAKVNQAAQSMVRLNTANGYGSTNTAIRRFTNTVTNQGSDITYADSATLGASFTINTSGVYAISYSESLSSSNTFGLSLNSTQLSTAINGITVADILAISQPPSANVSTNCGVTVYLAAGAVVRAHGAAQAAGTQPITFTITRVA